MNMAKRLLLVILLGASGSSSAVEILVGIADRNNGAIDVRGGKLVGSLAEYYQCPFDKSGLSFDLRPLPMVRSLYLLEQGQIDIAMPMVRVSERGEYGIFTHKLADIPFLVYTREDIDLSGDISQYRFTGMRASASGDLVAKRNAQFEAVTDWVQALRLAQIGRFDGAVIPATVIPNVDPGLFEGMRKKDFGSIPLSMYVSKKSRHSAMLVERLNSAIEACQG